MSVTCDRRIVFSGFSCFLHYKTDRHDITEILLKVTLNTITQPTKIEAYFSVRGLIYELCIWFLLLSNLAVFSEDLTPEVEKLFLYPLVSSVILNSFVCHISFFFSSFQSCSVFFVFFDLFCFCFRILFAWFLYIII